MEKQKTMREMVIDELLMSGYHCPIQFEEIKYQPKKFRKALEDLDDFELLSAYGSYVRNEATYNDSGE